MERNSVCSDRTLIVSYSYSGHTHRLAQALQTMTGGDRCEIYPWQPYPAAFPELLRQVKREIETQHHPRLLPVRRTPRGYSVLLVGTPNWCGTIAPPLASWLYRNDLSGKVILPFCSHCGGVSGDLRRDIQALCPRADVLTPLSILEDCGQPEPLLRQWLAQAGIPLARTGAPANET